LGLWLGSVSHNLCEKYCTIFPDIEISKQSAMNKYKDFTRSEIYAFLRLTIILTTLFLTATFTLLVFKGGFNEALVKTLFIVVIIDGFINIFIIWWRLKRTLYKYYNKLDDPAYKSTKTCKNIEKYSEFWEKLIFWTFLSCFLLFLGFLFSLA